MKADEINLDQVFTKIKDLINQADETTKDIQKDVAGKAITVLGLIQTKISTLETWLREFKDKK